MTQLHPRLEQDSHYVCRLDLCHLLLMNDCNYPWCILVPDREDITEIHQLEESDQQQLIRESSRLARGLTQLYRPDKLNIAAIGNLVPQLHLHHVVRYTGDPAWPKPVWGHAPAHPYTNEAAGAAVARLREVITRSV